MARGNESGHEVSPRSKAGVIVGYIAMVLGLLAVLAQASEFEALPLNLAAAIVLVHMVVGYAIGWLVQPIISRWFSM